MAGLYNILMSDLENGLVEHPDLPRGRGDPDFYPIPTDPAWVDPNRAKLEIHAERPAHWTELPKPVRKPRGQWEFGDNNPADPEQNLEKESL